MVAGEAVAAADYPSTASPETRTYHIEKIDEALAQTRFDSELASKTTGPAG